MSGSKYQAYAVEIPQSAEPAVIHRSIDTAMDQVREYVDGCGVDNNEDGTIVATITLRLMSDAEYDALPEEA